MDFIVDVLAVLGLLFVVLWFICGYAAYSLLARIKKENRTFKVFIINFLLGMVALGMVFYVAIKEDSLAQEPF